MLVEVAPAEGSKARLNITLTPDEVNSAIDGTYQRLGQRLKIPGFRPGKAPRPLLLRTYGDEAFYHQATDEAIRRWYPKALAESGVEAIDRGELDLLDEHDHVMPGEEFSFAAMVPTKPQIDLPDYSEIKIPPPSTLVTEEDVDKVIEGLRLQRATLEPAPSKSAAIGDVVRMSIHGRAQGDEVVAQDDYRFELVDETDSPDERFPGLSRELVESRPGDIREVVLPLPPDYADQALAGHGLSLRIVVKEILTKVLPELNDDFVTQVSGLKTVSELRSRLRRNLDHEKAHEASEKVAAEVIDSLIARSNVEAPDVLIEEEQDRLLRDQRRYFERRGLRFEQFLVAVKKSEEEYRDEIRPAAERAVKRDLILDAVAKAEGFEADPDAVEAQVQEMSQAASQSERDYERLAGSRRLHDSIAEEMRRRMALTKLVEMTSGLTPIVHEDDDHHDDGASSGQETATDDPTTTFGAAADPEAGEAESELPAMAEAAEPEAVQ